ncbi:MAG: hypothetical protein ACFFFK_02160, partial [Candidatus Thorarchaeota archaeon]
TDAYRSGHRLDYTKLKDAIREGKLGRSFHQKEWPQIRKVILQADEARASLANWKDEVSDKIRTRRRISLSLGYIFLPLGVGLSLIPIIFGISIDFSFALIALFIGAAFLIAGYVYYRIKLSEYIDAIYATEFEDGISASKKLKSLTQELINTLRSALKGRLEQGVYTEVRDVELELYNTDYEHIRYRGVTSRAKRLKKVYIEVE